VDHFRNGHKTSLNGGGWLIKNKIRTVRKPPSILDAELSSAVYAIVFSKSSNLDALCYTSLHVIVTFNFDINNNL
jgi:hypothetical protein